MIKKVIKKRIRTCYNSCPYFTTEGMEHSMVCGHPYFDDKPIYSNYIISHPECDRGFPKKCPILILRKKQYKKDFIWMFIITYFSPLKGDIMGRPKIITLSNLVEELIDAKKKQDITLYKYSFKDCPKRNTTYKTSDKFNSKRLYYH